MPNGVTFSDDRTLLKACAALMQDHKMSFEGAKAAIDRLSAAGRKIREPAMKEEKSANE